MLTQDKLNTKQNEDRKNKSSHYRPGKIGEAIARNLAHGNHPVILPPGSQQGQRTGASWGALATAWETAAAIKEADVIIPAIYFNSRRISFKPLQRSWRAKSLLTFPIQSLRMAMAGSEKIIGEQNLLDKSFPT